MNCYDCLHKTEINKELKCDRRVLWDGAIVDIKNPESSCPCHSSRDLNAEETRPNFSGLKRIESDDICPACGKMIKDESDFRIVKNQGGTRTKTCKICVEKGLVK